jgi:hypothetical protein
LLLRDAFASEKEAASASEPDVAYRVAATASRRSAV